MNFRRPLHLQTILFLTLSAIAVIPLLTFGLREAFAWKDEQVQVTKSKALFRSASLGRELSKIIDYRRRALETLASEMAEQQSLTSKKSHALLTEFRENFYSSICT